MLNIESSSALLPFGLTLLASRAQERTARWRTTLFWAGVIIGVLGSVLLCLAWLSPFLLIQKANGDLSNRWNTLCVVSSLMSALPVSILALFGTNPGRWLLFGAGLLLDVLSWAALLSNFV
jgi:hypothetical protein